MFFGNVGYRRVKLLEKGTYIADNPVLEIRHSRGNEGPSVDRIIYKRKRNTDYDY